MRTVRDLVGMLRRHYRINIGVATAMVAIAITLVVVFDSANEPTPFTQTDVSSNFKVCLLDTTQSNASAATVWNAIESATTKAPINAQHLTVPASSNVDPAPYLNSLIELRCQLVVTSGAGLTEALKATATNNPNNHFLNIGDPVNLPNVRAIPTSNVTPTLITDEVLAAQRAQQRQPH